MSDLRFTREHEWLKPEGGDAIVGITAYAQEQLGDVVFVELPEVGRAVEKGGDAAVVESVKAASDVFAPVDGEVVAINEALVDQPALVNSDPLGAGWFFRLKLSKPSQLDELMDQEGYEAYLAELG